MAILFIHGVNNRQEDLSYQQGQSLRKKMFEDIVLPPVREQHPEFDLLEDVYWGGLGVEFAWDLDSVPRTRFSEDMGAGSPGDVDSVAFVEKYADLIDELIFVSDGGKKSEPLAALAKTDPVKVIDLLTSPLLAQMEQQRIGRVAPKDGANTEKEGQTIASYITIAELMARDEAALADLRAATTDEQVLNTFDRHMISLAAASQKKASDTRVLENMGLTQDIAANMSKLVEKIKSDADVIAKRVKAGTIDKSLRAASLAVIKAKRQQLSWQLGRFFGDVFEYLFRGWEGESSIAETVRKAVEKGFEQSRDNEEPFAVITHSFGSMIFYDLLTSGAFDKLAGFKVDLWAMAGSQASVFAEMRLYKSSPKTRGLKKYPIAAPPHVTQWINFYDPADAMSYLMGPVFGATCTDIKVKEGANIKTAHGDYFAQPVFYEKLASAILGKTISLSDKKLQPAKN